MKFVLIQTFRGALVGSPDLVIEAEDMVDAQHKLDIHFHDRTASGYDKNRLNSRLVTYTFEKELTFLLVGPVEEI